MGLENQVALVTGAASDIGYAYVKCLLLNKVKVGKTTIEKNYTYIPSTMYIVLGFSY